MDEHMPSSLDKQFENQMKELTQLATKDALTGLLNRATMERLIEGDLKTMREDESCALFIIDLDNFKQVNDTLGHRAGDKAIRQSAQTLSQLFRATDIVGRLGGDEFVVFICGHIDEALVSKKAGAICENLQLMLGDQQTVNLTASVGVFLSQKPLAFENLYQLADQALYRAKRGGKNTFCLRSNDSFKDGPQVALRPVNAISLTKLLEEMDNGVALLEMGEVLQIIYVSPSFCRICGANYKTYLLPRLLSAITHPDDYEALEAALRKGLANNETVELVHRIYKESESDWIWLHIRATHVTYENPHPVLLVTVTDVSQFIHTQQTLEDANRRLQAAFDQVSMGLWEVDIATNTFHTFEKDGKPTDLGDSGRDFPKGLIAGGWIHPDSVEPFQRFAHELLQGKSLNHGNFIIRRHIAGGYGWTALSYQMVYDASGKPSKAVGIAEDFPRSFGDPLFWQNAFQAPMPEGLLGDLTVRARANLTLDTIETLWYEGINLNAQTSTLTCDTFLSQAKARMFAPEDAMHLKELFSRQALLQAFESGRHWLCGEYRRIDNSGSIHWMRAVFYLMQNPTSGHIMLFAYGLEIDQVHQCEQDATNAPVRDAASNLYDRQTLQTITQSLFAKASNGNHAICLLKLLGLDEAIAANGANIDCCRLEVGIILQLAVGASCIVGQYTNDTIALVFPSATSPEGLSSRIKTVLGFLHRAITPCVGSQALRFICGICVEPANTCDFNVMIAQAAQACALHQDASDDVVVLADPVEDWVWPQLQIDNENDKITVEPGGNPSCLTTAEKDIALNCISTMLSAPNLESSLLGVLQTLGTFYQADRVYTLSLTENKHVVIMTFEWTKPGKPSIQQATSGMRLERFSVLERCLEEKRPVSLARKRLTVHSPFNDQNATWHFTAFPLFHETEITGFFCIENATKLPLDFTLIDTLLPYLQHERERFQSKEHPLKTIDQLMGLPDLRAYMETVYTLNSDRYSALGVVCLDVPNLAVINGNSGFEYGSKLLWLMAKTLTEIFDASLLFRTWETEFIAFLPNTTQEVFEARVSRLYSILSRRYPKQIRIGRAWARNSFTAIGLVKVAKNAMSGTDTEMSEELQEFFQKAEDSLSGGTMSHEHRFTVYYQPKIDVQTGKLAGAEALARGIGKDGSIISPSQFVEFMEKDGTVRDLDLYVLEHGLAQIDDWRRAGLGLVPLSTNLSRVTLMQPTTPASVLAIQSHYPSLPAEALELEITERGVLEASELSRVVDTYRACGLRLALDDFGSQYANFSLFTNIKFDTVKLDISLIKELPSNPVNQALVRDIVQICKTYGINCVAEGVSSKDHADLLMDMGCPIVQGFYYDKPLPAEAFAEKYLQPGTHAPASN